MADIGFGGRNGGTPMCVLLPLFLLGTSDVGKIKTTLDLAKGGFVVRD